MLTVVLDAGPLITLCKFAIQGSPIIDFVLPVCRIVVSPYVEQEVAILGAKYADGVIAGERIARGGIAVISINTPKWAPYLAGYALGPGEKESIELSSQVVDADALVTDDYLAFLVAVRLDMTVWMLPDLIVKLTESHALPTMMAESILNAIRPRYRLGVIDHCLVRLGEVRGGRKDESW